ncbi:hypothetical protein vseg_000370 [Gypsophila vaccaria]
MVNLKFYKTGKSGKTLLWVIFFIVVVHNLIPMFPIFWNFMITCFSRLWLLIKWRPFIYVVVNFIIVSIFISSSNITHKLGNLINKLHRKSSHNISSLISQTSQKFLHPFDDDTWWSRIGGNEEREINLSNFSPLDDVPRGRDEKEEKTTSFEVNDELESYDEKCNDYVKEEVDEEDEEEVDTLDATWRAIMEAKNKGGGPQLKKSGTWTAGDRGGGDGDGEVGKVGSKGRLAKYKVELKKWKTFSRDVKEESEFGGGGGGGGGGLQKGVAEVALTYHDELKTRADAFIARVTHDMRLQRMESNQRFLDTISRGSK